MTTNTIMTVIKRDHNGNEVLRYRAECLTITHDSICVRAAFMGQSRDLGYVYLKTNDIFTEWFYTNRWYNIFRIEDVDSHTLKGWYCNFTRPAIITPDTIAADDLALDYFVYPDGRLEVLDADEYATLSLPPHEKDAVQAAQRELRSMIEQRQPPFDEITSASVE